MKNILKITWVKSHPGYAYFVGDSCELPEKVAKKLMKSGYVKKYEAPEPEDNPIDLPEDFPGRDALIAQGVKSLAEAKEIKDFTEIKGIGKSTDAAIHEYLKN